MASPPQGGFDCDFIDAISDSLLCPVCLNVVRDPHILSCCGVKICQTCLATYKTRSPSSRGPKCPKCRQYFQDFQEKDASRQILDLKVHCSRKGHGCNWEGELRYLGEHERETCQWVLVKCRHPECGLDVPRLHLSTHERHECVHRPVDEQLERFKSEMNHRYWELDSNLTDLTGQVATHTTLIEESNAIMARNKTYLNGKIRKVESELSRVSDRVDELENNLKTHAEQMKELENQQKHSVKAHAEQMKELQSHLRALEKRWKDILCLGGTGERG